MKNRSGSDCGGIGGDRLTPASHPALREESAVIHDYGTRYRGAQEQAVVAVEREVFGSDFGATGYTTVSQAKRLTSQLRLEASDRLLDIGAGAGWPGLYLSLEIGCRLVVTDLPIEGLLTAAHRAAEERISSRVSQTVCSARALPFRAGTFDAIVHTDVLC